MSSWYTRTCLHSAPQIEEAGVVTPHRHPMLGASLSWWSFDPHASALALGLASHHIVSCDRMEFLFAAHPDDTHLIVPWPSVSRQFQMGTYLDAAKGTRPGLWGVAFEVVRVVPHE
jgi:hypothetical protein